MGRAFCRQLLERAAQHEAELGERDARLAAMLKEREILLQERDTLHAGTQTGSNKHPRVMEESSVAVAPSEKESIFFEVSQLFASENL